MGEIWGNVYYLGISAKKVKRKKKKNQNKTKARRLLM